MEVRFSDGSSEQYKDEPSGFGSEGEIFRSQDGQHAAKLYYAEPTQEQKRIDRIDQLIKIFHPTSDPYWAPLFAWPEKRITHPRIGFRMPFVPGMKTLEHYLYSKSYASLVPEERGWFIGRIAVAIKLVNAAHLLSTKGLCFPDFSPKNILVDPFDGRMTLIDCDSLIVPGKVPATVDGSPEYQAPELVSQAGIPPSPDSVRHSLAVILYRWLLLWHPLMGDKVFDSDSTKDDVLRLGERAIYIEHPDDPSNRAKAQRYKSNILGAELEGLFKNAFVDGLHNRNNRPHAFEWREALLHAYDRLIPCGSAACEWRFFVARPLHRLICPWCDSSWGLTPTVPFLYLFRHNLTSKADDYNTRMSDAHYVVGWPGRVLHHWHIKQKASAVYADPRNPPDLTPQAIFEYNASTSKWYLKNLGLTSIKYTNSAEPSGPEKSCPMNASLALQDGMEMQLGPAPGHFRALIQLRKVV